MIATATELTRPGQSPTLLSPNDWSVAGTFDSIEQAERLLKRLQSQGAEACLSLIGGLSVMARCGKSSSYRPSMAIASSLRKPVSEDAAA